MGVARESRMWPSRTGTSEELASVRFHRKMIIDNMSKVDAKLS